MLDPGMSECRNFQLCFRELDYAGFIRKHFTAAAAGIMRSLAGLRAGRRFGFVIGQIVTQRRQLLIGRIAAVFAVIIGCPAGCSACRCLCLVMRELVFVRLNGICIIADMAAFTCKVILCTLLTGAGFQILFRNDLLRIGVNRLDGHMHFFISDCRVVICLDLLAELILRNIHRVPVDITDCDFQAVRFVCKIKAVNSRVPDQLSAQIL